MAFKFTICFLFLAIILTCANSSRMLNDVVEDQPLVAPTNTALPSGQIPMVAPTTTPMLDNTEGDVATPDAGVTPPAIPTTATTTPLNAGPGTTSNGPAASGGGAGAGAGVGAGLANPEAPQEPAMSFFMHDILGGSHPSARVVTGIISQTEVNGIPFSKSNNNFFPLSGGTPLLNNNNINQLINANTAPLLTGFNGAQTNTLIQNTGNNNNNQVSSNNLPFVTAGQLPSASSLQQLMFGTITVIDDELTEGHELGSAVLGRAQGFYLASSLDGTSQTVAVTVLLHNHENHDEILDTISFFGVHRTGAPISDIAVIGGTGKFEHAKGYATVETLRQEDQHTTDGVDTILHFSLYLITE